MGDEVVRKSGVFTGTGGRSRDREDQAGRSGVWLGPPVQTAAAIPRK